MTLPPTLAAGFRAGVPAAAAELAMGGKVILVLHIYSGSPFWFSIRFSIQNIQGAVSMTLPPTARRNHTTRVAAAFGQQLELHVTFRVRGGALAAVCTSIHN